jgi:hypothetical protein
MAARTTGTGGRRRRARRLRAGRPRLAVPLIQNGRVFHAPAHREPARRGPDRGTGGPADQPVPQKPRNGRDQVPARIPGREPADRPARRGGPAPRVALGRLEANTVDFGQAAAPAIRTAAWLLRKIRASRKKRGAMTPQNLRDAQILRDDASAR